MNKKLNVPLSTGLKFYSDFANLLSQLREDVKDWTRVRRIEARDLSNQLAQSVSGMSLSGVPSPNNSPAATQSHSQQYTVQASQGTPSRKPIVPGTWNQGTPSKSNVLVLRHC